MDRTTVYKVSVNVKVVILPDALPVVILPDADRVVMLPDPFWVVMFPAIAVEETTIAKNVAQRADWMRFMIISPSESNVCWEGLAG